MEYLRKCFNSKKSIILASKYIPIHKLQNKEMNKIKLSLVFLSGIVFAFLASYLKSSLKEMGILSSFYSGSIGILPPDVNVELMDDGYVAMSMLGSDYSSKELTRKKPTELEEKSMEVEALNTLKAAVELVNSGKTARAGRLLEHAHSLAPRHPDILVAYGEFLEKERNDIVKADFMFLKALAISPANSRALRNRKRTQPIVDKLDSVLFTRIDDKRDSFEVIPSASAALRRIKKEAYIHQIYHTAGIEGNTLSLAQTRTILETGLGIGGKSILEHNEILGLDLALKYINTTLVHRIGKITLSDILEIHRRVLAHSDPLESGRLRTTQVYVSDHIPPPPNGLECLMEEFINWLNSENAQKMHPIKYSALAHYKFVFIHPFIDGNGRTARLLMNFLLMQAGYPPIIIRKQDRLMYYSHLQTANDGDTRPFVRFIAHCAEKTIDVYLWATKDHFPELEESAKEEKHLPLHERKTIGKKEAPDRFISGGNTNHIFPNEDLNSDGDSSSIFSGEGPLWLLEKEETFQSHERFGRVLTETDIHDSYLSIMKAKEELADIHRNNVKGL